jgi:hypothetical protein
MRLRRAGMKAHFVISPIAEPRIQRVMHAPLAPKYGRSLLAGPTFAGMAGGSVANGRFQGKMIMLASVMDVQAFAWNAE